MHLIRLLISGITLLSTGGMEVRVGDKPHRYKLLTILGMGRCPGSRSRIGRWSLSTGSLTRSLASSPLPEMPDTERINRFLIRGLDVPSHLGDPNHEDRPPSRADRQSPAIPIGVFQRAAGAHLYGFESLDSDRDLRGVHVLAPRKEVVGLDIGPLTLSRTPGWKTSWNSTSSRMMS